MSNSTRSLKRLESQAKKLVEGKEKKAQREEYKKKYKDWTLDMLLEQSTLSMYFPDISQDEIDQDILTRGFRLPSDDRFVIRYGIQVFGEHQYRDPFAELDSI